MTATDNSQANSPPFELNFSRQFESWFQGFNASIAFSTYQAGKVFMIGMGDNRISIAERTFARCMGLSARADRLYLASLNKAPRASTSLPGAAQRAYSKRSWKTSSGNSSHWDS